MTGEQILRGMTLIDDVFIREAAPAEKTERRSFSWIRYAAAACVCVAFAGILIWQAVRPVTASAFQIEDGVLLAYTGTDSQVVIPDEVTKIAASTFEAAPSPDSITSIVLGTNVETIDPLTFAKTTALENIVVPEENKNFYYKDGVLLAADGSIVIDTTRAYEDSMDLFVEVTEEIAFGKNIFGEEARFIFGKAEITVAIEENPAYITGNDFREFNCYITAIDFDGAHLELADRVPLISNYKREIVQAEDMLIYVAGGGKVYLLVDGQVKDISNALYFDPDGYNVSFYTYDQDDQGNITYTRQPSKYVFDQEEVFDLLFCTARDEFFMEEGYVTWGGKELIYTPTVKYTVGEVWDLERKFEKLKKSMEIANSTFDYPPCETLDELLEYNREHYERAE